MLYVALGIVAGVGVVLLIQAWSAVLVYRGATERRPRVVTAEQRQPTGAVAELLGNLTGLGFRRLGEVELTVPDTGIVGSLARRQRQYTSWLMVDSPATTLAEVSEIGPLTSLETWLADDSVVQTTSPVGEDIDEPGLRASAISRSVADAYQHHRLMVDGRAGAHGQPRGMHSMGDHLRNDADYRRRFARRYLRRALITRRLLPAGLAVVLALVMLSWIVPGLLTQ